MRKVQVNVSYSSSSSQTHSGQSGKTAVTARPLPDIPEDMLLSTHTQSTRFSQTSSGTVIAKHS
jgi:hypothetical protein